MAGTSKTRTYKE